ncbi:MAG: pilin [Candidatus Berkelbacteria bacterium]|nr:pilin [Candidatus Berkelbacteria bacterium]
MENLIKLISQRAYAQVGEEIDRQLNPTPWVGGDAGDMIWALLSNVLSRFPYFLGGLAFVALLYAGALYIFSTGDPQKMEMAKKNIVWVIIGVLAVAMIYAALAAVAFLVRPRIG